MTWVGKIHPLEKGKATYSTILGPGEFHGLYKGHMDPWDPWGHKKSQLQLSDFPFHFTLHSLNKEILISPKAASS